MKKIIALILVLATIFSMNVLVLGTSAAKGDSSESETPAPENTGVTLPDGKVMTKGYNDGTDKTGWIAVGTAAEFKAIEAGKKYYLTADIDLTGVTTAALFAGAGYTATAEVFTLDGCGYTVTIDKPIFAQMPYNSTDKIPSEIKNLVIEGSISVKASDFGSGTYSNGTAIASLVGKSNGGIYTNIVNNANVTQADGFPYANDDSDSTAANGNSRVAGIIGAIFNAPATVTNCINNGTINGYSKNSNGYGVGGVIGSCATPATITNVVNNGDVTAYGCSGGIIANLYSAGSGTTFTNCENTGDVSGAQVGGVVGFSGNESFTVTNFSNSGNLTASANVGGVLGRGYFSSGSTYGTSRVTGSAITNAKNTGAITTTGGSGGGMVGQSMFEITIENCVNYATGTVNATGYAGGIAGQFYYGYIYNCVNEADVTNNSFAGGITGALYGNTAATNGIIKYCYNTGDITSKVDRCAGGITGYISSNATIQYNVSIADVKQLATADNNNGADPVGASAIAGYAASNDIIINDNFFMGTVSAPLTKNTFAAAYGPVALGEGVTEYYPNVGTNYFYFTDGTPVKYYTAILQADSNSDTSVIEPAVVTSSVAFTAADVATLDQVKGGYIAYAIQAAIDAADKTVGQVWGQAINTDANPVLGGKAVKKAEGAEVYYNDGFTGALTLKDDLILNAWVNASVLDDSALSVKFTMNGVANDAIAASVADKYYAKASFTDIAPQYIGEEITVALYLGETELVSDTISIVEYLEKIVELNADKNTDIAKALLRYGYEARAYVIAKQIADEADVAEIKSELLDTTALAAPNGVPAVVHEKNTAYDETFCFYSANVHFDNVNRICLTVYIPEAKAATAKVMIGGEEVKLVKVSNGVYEVSSADIYAKAFGDHITAILYDGETVVGTLKYSINNYADRIAASATASAEMKALALATYHYGVAAAAYVAE